MMNFKSFEKEGLLKFIKEFGFEVVEEDAFLRVVLTVEVMVYNLLNNVKHISNSLSLKTIKKSHFEAVMKILNEQRTNLGSQQTGGHAGTVLPSEYFGINSGRYFDATVVQPSEQSAFAAGVSRAAITYQHGGCEACKVFMGKDQLKFLVDEFKTAKHATFKVSGPAYDVMLECLRSNLRKLFETCRKQSKSKTLSLKLLVSVMSKHFPYMDYSLKQ